MPGGSLEPAGMAGPDEPGHDTLYRMRENIA